MDSAPNAHISILCATYFVLADDHKKRKFSLSRWLLVHWIYDINVSPTFRQHTNDVPLNGSENTMERTETLSCHSQRKKKNGSKYVMRKVCFVISVFSNARQHQRMQIKMKSLRQLAKQILFSPGKEKKKNRMLSTGMKCYFVFNK